MMGHNDQPLRLVLLGGFECRIGEAAAPLPLGAQRLLALLALNPDGVHRVVASGRLWPGGRPERAAANLRSALWRGKRLGDRTLIVARGPRLRLCPSVTVDVHDAWRRLRDADVTGPPTERASAVADLGRELLPDWPDPWLTYERERWDQLRQHGLERIAKQLQARGAHLDALETALQAIALEPIRETAHRIVVEVHIAEGNTASALRHYQRYRGLLHRELGVAPSARMDELVGPLTWAWSQGAAP